jgi:AraC-like DNA-binding protein
MSSDHPFDASQRKPDRSALERPHDQASPVAPPLVRRVIAIIRGEIDHRFTLAQLGALVDRSPWHLNLVFEQWTQMSIHEYATTLRMSEAAAEIRRGVKIEAVALSLGYRSPKTLYRQFEHFFGVIPFLLRRARARASSAPASAGSPSHRHEGTKSAAPRHGAADLRIGPGGSTIADSRGRHSWGSPPMTGRRYQHLLSSIGVLRHPCDLDLLLFFHRHPRSILTSERLAAYVGYDLVQLARSLDVLTTSGLLERSQHPTHAARLYVLKKPLAGWLTSVLEIGSTREGREDLIRAIREARHPESPQADTAIDEVHRVRVARRGAVR